MVELAFNIDHLSFRVRGQVRAVQSDTQIGFEFLDPTKEERRKLEKVIEDLLQVVVKRFAGLTDRP